MKPQGAEAAAGAGRPAPDGHRYRLFGFELRSEIPLPGLLPSPAEGEADVCVRLGELGLPDGLPPGYSLTELGTVLTVPEVGRFLIRRGAEILIEPNDDAPDSRLRTFLMGSAMGAILHQRGILPLHANAIEVDGRVVAFCGRSGIGKSTLAAWFHDRGHRIFSDDVCAVALESGGPMVHPGLPRLRLWEDALQLTGRSPAAYEPSPGSRAKYEVPTGSDAGLDPAPLDRVYLLADAAGRDGAIRRLRGMEAVEALVSNTFRGGYARSIGRTGEHLMACSRLAAAVPVFVAERVRGLGEFDRQARWLEEHVRLRLEQPEA